MSCDSESLKKEYNSFEIEGKWYEYWENQGYFKALDKSEKFGYSIVIPPPNVTGVLHMGHALNITIQDIMCRYRRLNGDNVLWMPGTDHAGIATQNVVERNLAKKGITREQIGREKFIKAVWKWREKSGGAIINQLKRIGASCDWARERFTMDKGLSNAVRKVFVMLYKDNLIYEGEYIINWCPRCKTALSDLEVEYEDKDSLLYYIKYPFENGKNSLVVATTRPETMFGDTAVAINPFDKRYEELSNKNVILPLTDKIIPVIKDEYVDTEFGTGALKVTPAHDLNDFNLGEKHNLTKVKVIDDHGNMTENAGKFVGLDRFECREKVIQELDNQGLLVKKEVVKNSLGHCYRCKNVVEPFLSKQWFVKAAPLAKQAANAVRDGRTRIIPDSWTKTYFDWLDNIRDWCISRQIWWGHRIPVWKCSICKQVIVEENDPDKCTSCGSKDIIQETDVLDTWFSSALWPFSTMGWPEKTDLLKTFYPTSALVTGFDILFFWVARMMMMGTRFMGDVPFKDVYIHALVRDEHGKKMSKSKGNVIDPIKIIDKFGADAFRFTLAAFAAQGRDVKMSEERVQGHRYFVNKLWNAAKFALIHLDDKQEKIDYKNLAIIEKWILSRALVTAEKVKKGIETYKFNEAANSVYQFVWHEFCDWYLEAVKPCLYGKDKTRSINVVKSVLAKVLKDILIMLHPFMPFVTEEIWSVLPNVKGSVMRADFPCINARVLKMPDLQVEKNMEFVFSLISAIRNIRSEINIKPSINLTVNMETIDDKEKNLIKQNSLIIQNLARLEKLEVLKVVNNKNSCTTSVLANTVIYVFLEGVIDLAKEKERLEKEIEKITKELLSVSKRLNNENFLEKAPEDVVEKVKNQRKFFEEKNDKLKGNLDRINQIQN
ncbi:MAG: valine--tRNA ligase [Desulfobacteraceae bacterium 4572_130]|nr:MAG: valine--tRNA ligase [Desulfobacteraceae bacterium 4572_130]